MLLGKNATTTTIAGANGNGEGDEYKRTHTALSAILNFDRVNWNVYINDYGKMTLT